MNAWKNYVSFTGEFQVDDVVTYSAVAGEIEGQIAGIVLGYFSNYMPIILLHKPKLDGTKACVMHDSVLKLNIK